MEKNKKSKSFLANLKIITFVLIIGVVVLTAYQASAITSITLTAPAGGQFWSGTNTISWDSVGTSDTVNIKYSTNGFATSALIATSTSATGTYAYSWNTAQAADGSTYKIKVEASSSPSIFGTSTSNFAVDNTAPGIVFTDDVAAAPVATSDAIIITVSDTNASTVSYSYGYNSTSTCDASSTYGNSFTSGVSFDVATDTNNGKYICAKALDRAGNATYKASANSLNIDVTPPTIVFTNDIQYGSVLGSENITISVSDANASTASYQYGFNSTNTCSIASTYDNSFVSGSTFAISDNLNNGKYICAKALDRVGNVTYKASAYAQDISYIGGGFSLPTVLPLPIVPTTTPNIATSTGSTSDKIAEIKAKIADMLAQLAQAQQQLNQKNGSQTIPLGFRFTQSLSFGQTKNDVTDLQLFLKSQGAGIYPEGKVTGYFGSLTKQAVIRFQLKYNIISDASSPVAGLVGPKTRAKINEMLGR
jgi:hypothetical protein